MKNHFLLTLIAAGLFSSSRTWAMFGDVDESVPDSVCQLVISGPQGDIRSICTGSLISTNEVATAAHCVAEMLFKSEKKTLTVKCGYRGVDPGEMVLEKTLKSTSFYSRGIEFAETFQAQEVHIDADGFWSGRKARHDVGRVVLNGHSKLRPLDLATEEEMAMAFLMSVETSPSLDVCLSSGFGINAHGTAGLPLSTRFKNLFYFEGALEHRAGRLQVLPDEIPLIIAAENSENPHRAFAEFLVNKKYLSTSLEPGDSGGPLICSRHGQWKLFGVAHGQKLEFSTSGMVQMTTQWAPYQPRNIDKKIY